MKKHLYFFLSLTLVILALVGGVFIYRRGIEKTLDLEDTVSSLIPVATLESTPTPEIKREDLSLKVLNGLGVSGTANKAKDYLESLGYKSIKVGNADSFDYEETEILVKKDKEDYFDLLKEDLSVNYIVSEKKGLLDTENSFDAVIVIAK